MFKMKPIASSIALSLMTGIAVAAAPGGAILQNKVIATYSDIGGKTYTAESNIVEISIREVRTATLTITSGAEQQVAMIPSSKVYSVHTLTNNGNVSETFALAAANVTGSDDSLDAAALKVYLDANGNGVLDSGETTPITSTTLAAGASAKLIVESVLPAAMAVSDKLNVTLDATDSKGTAATTTNTVKITFKDTNVASAIHIWEQASSGNCHAYTFVEPGAAITWASAKTAAEQLVYMGKIGHLLTSTSPEENAFVVSKMPTTSGGIAWIGLQRPSNTWVTGEAFSYHNWSVGSPSGNSNEPAVAMVNSGSAWGGLAGQWHDAVGTLADNRSMYAVEFDIPCELPSVKVELEGAKDVDCDGAVDADSAFGTAKLEDMYSGECAIMRSRATNTSKALAKGVILHYTVPQYASYLAGSTLFKDARQTDVAGDDDATYNANLKKITVNAGDLAAGTTSPDAQFSVKID